MGIMGVLTSGLLPRVTGAPSPWAPTEEKWTQEHSGTFPASRTYLKVVLGRDEEAGAFTHPPLPFICWMLTHRHRSRTNFVDSLTVTIPQHQRKPPDGRREPQKLNAHVQRDRPQPLQMNSEIGQSIWNWAKIGFATNYCSVSLETR